ncbi:MAG: hypothetical protein QM696_07955 [Steroidobacteraceae bacterium]
MRITDFLRRLCIAALLAGLAACAWRAPGTGEDPAHEFSAAGDRAYEVSVAWIGGRPALAWHGGRLEHDALFIRYADQDGRPDGPQQQLTDATRHAFEPSLQEMDGEALVAWYEQDAARHQVALLARFDAQGRQRWRRELSAVAVNGRNPVVRVAGGVAHVAWIEQRGGTATLRWAEVDAAGQWRSAPQDLAPASPQTWNLNAAVGADGSFHVVYDAGVDSRAKELHWLRIRGGHVEERRLGADDGHDSVYPDLALDGGRAALTWFDYRDGNAEVYLRCARLGVAGSLPGNLADEAAARRITHSPGESIGAYLAWRAAHIELAWTDAGAQGTALWWQHFDRDCRPLDAAHSLSSPRGLAGIPSLAVSPRGLALAWSERRGTPEELARPGHDRRTSSVALLRVWRGYTH